VAPGKRPPRVPRKGAWQGKEVLRMGIVRTVV